MKHFKLTNIVLVFFLAFLIALREASLTINFIAGFSKIKTKGADVKGKWKNFQHLKV